MSLMMFRLGLSAGSSIRVKISAVNSQGESALSSEATLIAMTAPIAAPTLSYSGLTTTSLILSWT